MEINLGKVSKEKIKSLDMNTKFKARITPYLYPGANNKTPTEKRLRK
jgi:hypothetical protein